MCKRLASIRTVTENAFKDRNVWQLVDIFENIGYSVADESAYLCVLGEM